MNDLPILIGDGLSDKQVRFINAYLSNYCNVSKSCTSASVARSTYYEWKNRSDNFAQAVEQAEEALKDRLVDEINKHIFEDRNPIVLNKFAPKMLKDRGLGDEKDINLTGNMSNDNEVIVTIIDGGEVEDYDEG